VKRRSDNRLRATHALAAILSLAAALPVSAQPVERLIRLEDAVATALRSGADSRVAAANTEAASAGARMTTSALYPLLSLESGVMRSSDPVAAFGTKLRQGRFGEADFAIDALNDPDPVTNWTTGVRVAWGGLDPAAWAASRAAGNDAEAARIAETRVREAVRFGTTAAYYAAVRGEARVRAAAAALEAARATGDRFQRRLDEGLLTEADLLRAQAEVAAAEAGRLAARQERDDARRALGLALGWTADSIPVPADGMIPPADVASAESAGPGGEPDAASVEARLEDRADLRALRARLDAAEGRAGAASSGWFPRLEAFGAIATHARDPFTSDASDWTVGVGLRWDAFTGFRRPAGASRARAEAQAVRIELDRTRRAAVAEVRQAAESVETARLAVEATDLASAAAGAGRDLMRRRFEEGLAGPSDLLQAEARAAEMEREAIDALAGYHVAVARLEYVLGDRTGGASAPDGESTIDSDGGAR